MTNINKTIEPPKDRCYIDLGEGKCLHCENRYCICKKRRDGTWENDLPVYCPPKSNNINKTIQRFREKFPGELIRIINSPSNTWKTERCEKEIEQFITTEIQGLLEGLKGEEKRNHFLEGLRKMAENVGYNEREMELRDDIDLIIKENIN